MTHRFLYVLCGLLAVATPASPQQTEWKDPSPHAVKSGDRRHGRAARGVGLGWLRSGARSSWRGVVIRRTCSTILRRHWPRGTASSA